MGGAVAPGRHPAHDQAGALLAPDSLRARARPGPARAAARGLRPVRRGRGAGQAGQRRRDQPAGGRPGGAGGARRAGPGARLDHRAGPGGHGLGGGHGRGDAPLLRLRQRPPGAVRRGLVPRPLHHHGRPGQRPAGHRPGARAAAPGGGRAAAVRLRRRHHRPGRGLRPLPRAAPGTGLGGLRGPPPLPRLAGLHRRHAGLRRLRRPGPAPVLLRRRDARPRLARRGPGHEPAVPGRRRRRQRPAAERRLLRRLLPGRARRLRRPGLRPPLRP